MPRCESHFSKPVVLIYHDVPSVADNHSVDLRTFESHIIFDGNFDFITSATQRETPTLAGFRWSATFDDGFAMDLGANL